MLRKKSKYTPTEKYIANNADDSSIGGNPKLIKNIFFAFPALKNRNVRLYFFGQFVSQLGNWLQTVAQAWLVLTLTNSPLLIGLVAACQSVPTIFLSLFGGVIVDHFPKKTILTISHFILMFLAVTMGLLTISGHINIYEVMIIALIFGVVNSISTPAHYAYANELVKKEEISSVMSLNAGVLNIARVIGPSIAGLLILIAGTGGAIILNGISFFAVIFALSKIKIAGKTINEKLNPIKSALEGITYSYKNPMIRAIILFLSMMSIFGWSYATIIPILAKNIYGVGATGMGYLFTATGVGAVVATVLVSIYSKKITKLFVIIAGTFVFALSLFSLSFVSNFYLGLFLLFTAGAGLLGMFVVLGTMITTLPPQSHRGRVFSIYYLVYMGFMPLGNIEIGYLTEHLSLSSALRINSLVVFFLCIFISFTGKYLRRAQLNYNKEQSGPHK